MVQEKLIAELEQEGPHGRLAQQPQQANDQLIDQLNAEVSSSQHQEFSTAWCHSAKQTPLLSAASCCDQAKQTPFNVSSIVALPGVMVPCRYLGILAASRPVKAWAMHAQNALCLSSSCLLMHASTIQRNTFF